MIDLITLFAMSDELVVSLLTAFLTAAMSAFVAWLGYLTQKLNKKVESVAQTGEQTHALANSAMLEQKRANAVVARALSDTDPANKVYAAAASIAEDTYRQHLNQQKIAVPGTEKANEARKEADFQKPVIPPIVTVVKLPE